MQHPWLCTRRWHGDWRFSVLLHRAGRISHVRGGDPSFQCPYLRCAWSAAKEEDLAEGMRRVGRAVRRHLDGAGSAAEPAQNGQMSRIQL